MPNWCNNFVTIEHKNKTAIDRVVKAFDKGRLCEEFIPVPEYIKDEKKVEKYGLPSWYTFCVSNWGTKWDIQGDVSERSNKSVSLRFDSAWSPPTGLYRKLTDEGYHVMAYYCEFGMAYAGEWSSEEGDRTYDIKDAPKELDEMFGISETLEEVED